MLTKNHFVTLAPPTGPLQLYGSFKQELFTVYAQHTKFSQEKRESLKYGKACQCWERVRIQRKRTNGVCKATADGRGAEREREI